MTRRRGFLTLTLAVGGAATLLACSAWWRAPARGLPSERGAPVLYVALGDSTVEGVGASRQELTYVVRLYERLRAIYPTAQLRNLGVGGSTSADVLAAQVPPAVELAPHLVTLSVGPNDITTRVSVREYEANVRAILTRLARETGAVIVVNLMPDLAVTPRFRDTPQRDLVGRLAAQFNEALARQARAHGAEVVDLFEPSRAEVPARPELVSRDGYHPSDYGYARWAELVWPGIERRITR